MTVELPPGARPVRETCLAGDRAPPDAAARLCGTMAIGTPASAEFPAETGPPLPGSLSVVLDAAGRGVGVVETVAIDRVRFGEVAEGFAALSGGRDGTLATWRRECGGARHARVAARLGVSCGEDTALACEVFRLVRPATERP